MMEPLSHEIHNLVSKRYRVVFDYDTLVHAIRVTVDGEKDVQAFQSSQRIPRVGLPYAAEEISSLESDARHALDLSKDEARRRIDDGGA